VLLCFFGNLFFGGLHSYGNTSSSPHDAENSAATPTDEKEHPTMSPDTAVGQPKGSRKRVGQSRLGTLLVLAVTAAAVMVGAYLVDRPADAKTTGVSAVDVGASDGPAPKVGSPAHDFTATTVDGKKVSLSSYKGHPVWLTFGASWCAACQAEAPDIEAAYKKHLGAGVTVLAISISEDSRRFLTTGSASG